MGHERDAQMTALEVKSVYLAPHGRSQVLSTLGSDVIFLASLTVVLPFSCYCLLVYLTLNFTFYILSFS